MNQRVPQRISGERNLNLDLVKLLSCIAIIGQHCFDKNAFMLARVMHHIFGFAIPCFFMAGGYMLLNKKSVSWRYVFGKILRFVRFVMLWNLLGYLVFAAKGLVIDHTGLRGLITCFVDYLKSFYLACFMQKTPFMHFWYIGTTMLLYLLLPLLLRVFRRKGEETNRKKPMLLMWIALLVISAAMQAASTVLGWAVQSKVPQAFRLWCSLQYFLLGGMMPDLVEWMKKKLRFGWHLGLMLFVTVVSVALRVLVGVNITGSIYAEYFYDAPLFILWAMLFFSLMMRLNLNKAAEKFTALFVPSTMVIYAMHRAVLSSRRVFVRPASGLGCAVDFIYCMVICFAAAALLRKIRFAKYWVKI